MDAPPVQYVTTSDGYDIAYSVTGEGRPFVFMPRPFNHLRILGAVESNRAAFVALASRFQLIRYDSRGQGMSTRGLSESHTAEHFERDLEAVVDRLRLERFVLLGVLGFGGVAIHYAAQHPERVEALILFNPRSGDESLDRNSPPSVLVDDLPLQDWEFFLEAHGRTGYPLEDWALAKEWMRESMDQSDREAMRRTLVGVSTEGVLAQVQAPTLVLATRAGGWAYSTEEASMVIAAAIPNARFAVFDDAGGGLFLPGPKTPPAVSLISDFLSDVPRTAEPGFTGPAAGLSNGLSAREFDVLRLVAAGRSNAQIADELVISASTVAKHVSSIFAKTGAANRTEAAGYARDRGLV
jgi:pimeloyl-ACP methyl ester carboxylesterase/DNA-binding CsgD family transcriptional regulator